MTVIQNGGLIAMPEQVLEHYGVKGMKWGVRRYQNKGGSYTKKGLEKFKKAEERYDSAKAEYQKTKDAYKKGAATKYEVRDSKSNLKMSKNEMSNIYKKLKTDKLADEGKELYSKGKTITSNKDKLALSEFGVLLGSKVASSLIQSKIGNYNAAQIAQSSIALGGTAINAILASKNYMENKRLRAYYAHS